MAKRSRLSLGRATPYVFFSGESIVNERSHAATYIAGSAGTSPGDEIEGFANWQISGSQDRNNQVARNARADLFDLYAAIDSRGPFTAVNPWLAGTVTPGNYESNDDDFAINKTLTLVGEGNPNSVFI